MQPASHTSRFSGRAATSSRAARAGAHVRRYPPRKRTPGSRHDSRVWPLRRSGCHSGASSRPDTICERCPQTGQHGTTLWYVIDLAAVGAFAAAGLSLVNVGISARLASRVQREQWRRDEERPMVARCLTLSADAARAWWDGSVAMDNPDDDGPDPRAHLSKGSELLRDLRFEVAQLDLLASSPVRQSALALVEAHESEMLRLMYMEPGQDDSDCREAAKLKVEELQAALVQATRTDLGLDFAKPVKDLLGYLFPGMSGA